MGTIASNIVKKERAYDSFMSDDAALKQVVETAGKLVTDNIGEVIW